MPFASSVPTKLDKVLCWVHLMGQGKVRRPSQHYPEDEEHDRSGDDRRRLPVRIAPRRDGFRRLSEFAQLAPPMERPEPL